MLRTLTMRTELMCLEGVSALEWHDGYAVQSTPSEPDFWFGNQLILPSFDLDGPTLDALFVDHFPKAAHRSFVWDIVSPDVGDVPDLTHLGAVVEKTDALVLSQTLSQVRSVEGIELRRIKDAADWAKVTDLMAEVGVEEGHDPIHHRPFLESRNRQRQALIAAGKGAWFGAFEGDRLVAHMGMFHTDSVARFQNVETRKSHRRRGLCSALLRTAALWALGRAPDAQVVIVAEADSDASRLYRRMGFTHAETLYGALKPGY